MAPLDYTDIQPGTYCKMDGAILEVIAATFSKKSRQKGSNQVRMKNLSTGAVITKTLHASDKIEEVILEKREYQFVYARNDEAVIHPKDTPSERITIPIETVQNIHLIPSGATVTALQEGDTIVTLQPPIKVDLTVTEAPPSIRGNTTQGGTKKVTVETGASITTPLFIEAGDRIRVKTATGEYTERVAKG
ncbi:MAG: elongation factor P [Candidatus Kaiserbacteria bacterium]|nr:elongation factor P [Candidatus Kaiserbacteria bacterium]